jgi:hypothetical protein
MISSTSLWDQRATLTTFEGARDGRVVVKNSTDLPFVIVADDFGPQWMLPGRSRGARTCAGPFDAQIRAESWALATATHLTVSCGELLLIDNGSEVAR